MTCDSSPPPASSSQCSEYPWGAVGSKVSEPSVTDPKLVLLNTEAFWVLKGRTCSFKHFSGEQMASSWTPPGNLCSFKGETRPIELQIKSIVDCVITSKSHILPCPCCFSSLLVAEREVLSIYLSAFPGLQGTIVPYFWRKSWDRLSLPSQLSALKLPQWPNLSSPCSA